jgi:multiple sugar transport system substrate-binding protein
MLSFMRARRSLVVGAVGLTLLAVTSGCATASSDGADGEAVELSLQIWNPADKAGVQNAIDAFEDANQNIDVTLEQVPEDQYYTKLDASLGAGEGPDVMWQSSRAQYYIDGGAIEPLDDYIAEDNLDLTALYPEQLVDLYNFDDQQYGIPKDQDVWMWVYNTAVFEALGVTDVPTTDWTWDDMVRIAEEVKAKQDGSYTAPMYYPYFFNNGGVSGVIKQLGGEFVEDNEGTVNSAEGIEAYEKVKALQDDGLILPVASSGDFNAPTALISGQIAFSKTPSWLLSLLSTADVPEGTFVAVPQPEIDGSRATDTNGLSYTMNSNSSHKDEAWDLIKFLTSDEGAKLHAEGGAAQPANLSADVKAAYFEANKSVSGLKETFEATIPDQFLRITTEYTAVREIGAQIESTVMAPFYAGTLTADQATQQTDDLVNEALSK